MALLTGWFDKNTDANDDPLSGALVYVYLPGTTTPVSVFSDEEMTVPAANPIVCDSAGVLPIRYVAVGTYKIRVTTSAGAEVRTTDDFEVGGAGGTVTLTNYGKPRSLALLEAFDSSVAAVQTTGYATSGDGGAALYKRVGSEPNHSGKFQDGNDDWWELAVDAVTPPMLGAVGNKANGTTACDTEFANAVAAAAALGAEMRGRSGDTYRLTSSVSITSSDIRIIGNGAAIRFTGVDDQCIEFNGTVASRLSNVEVSGWRVTMDDGWSHFVYAAATTGVRVTGNTITGGRLFRSWLPTDSAGLTGASWDSSRPNIAAIEDDAITRDVTIADNKVTGGLQTVGTGSRNTYAAIQFGYVQGGTASNNVCRSDRNGIIWNGGDANPARDGGVGSTRMVRNLKIFGNECTDMTAGGIWGSQGAGITVSGNVAERCEDIGIHGEGDQDATYSGNYARNCEAGCYTPFFECENTVYDGNVGVIDDDAYNQSNGWPVLVKWNNSTTTVGTSVTFTNNTFENRIGSGNVYGLALFQVGGSIIYRGNTHRNVIFHNGRATEWNTGIDTSFNASFINAGKRVIAGNTFTFDYDTSEWFYVITLGPNLSGVEWEISGNRVEIDNNLTVSNSAGFLDLMFGGGITTTVRDNNVDDLKIFVRARSFNNTGSVHPVNFVNNAGAADRAYICLTDGVDVVAPITRFFFEGEKINDRGTSLVPLWNGTPTSDTNPKMSICQRGSMGRYSEPSPADYMGWVCTNTGGIASSGTWTSASGDYSVGDQVEGSDGYVYRCVTASGSGDAGNDPASDSDSSHWYRIALSVAVFKEWGATTA